MAGAINQIVQIEAKPERDSLAPLRFERRASVRNAAIGSLEAVRSDGFGPPVVVQLRLLDESAGGIAATSDRPMPPGARLRVRVCPVTGRWRDGVVVRCTPNGAGYRVALAFAARRAA